MSESSSKIEVNAGVARRRRFTVAQRMAIIAETLQPGISVSYVARRHGLSPSLVFRWRGLISEGRREAVRASDEVVRAFGAEQLEEKVRELERLLGRKTMEVEILREKLGRLRSKK
jgi:transposase